MPILLVNSVDNLVTYVILLKVDAMSRKGMAGRPPFFVFQGYPHSSCNTWCLCFKKYSTQKN